MEVFHCLYKRHIPAKLVLNTKDHEIIQGDGYVQIKDDKYYYYDNLIDDSFSIATHPANLNQFLKLITTESAPLFCNEPKQLKFCRAKLDVQNKILRIYELKLSQVKQYGRSYPRYLLNLLGDPNNENSVLNAKMQMACE